MVVHLKSAEERKQEALSVEYYRLRRKNLWGLIFISVLIHGLGLLLLVKLQSQETNQGKQVASKPIDFVVVPAPEPKLESSQPEEETTEEPVVEETEPEPVAPTPESTPPPEELAETTPEAIAPAPTPEPVEPEPEVIEPAEQTPVLSGSDPNQVTAPKPEPEPEPEPEPAAQPSSPPEAAPTPASPEPIATNLPPEKPTVPIPESVAPAPTPETTPEPSQSGGAASLLGGDYQKTYADSGAESFFSPEALSYNAVLDPEQLKALKGFDLEAYQRGLYERVKRNWKPSFREKYTTWLSFNIEKNGQISQLQVVESSGSEEFDRTALEAVQNAVPLEALPADFPLESLEFKYQFYLY